MDQDFPRVPPCCDALLIGCRIMAQNGFLSKRLLLRESLQKKLFPFFRNVIMNGSALGKGKGFSGLLMFIRGALILNWLESIMTEWR